MSERYPRNPDSSISLLPISERLKGDAGPLAFLCGSSLDGCEPWHPRASHVFVTMKANEFLHCSGGRLIHSGFHSTEGADSSTQDTGTLVPSALGPESLSVFHTESSRPLVDS